MRCPNCNNEITYHLDEWGYTPWHLHCDVCHINIGATSIKKCNQIFEKYNDPLTYIEYFNNEIHQYGG